MDKINFVIRKSKWRQKYWVSIVHENGNVLFHSENYSRREDAWDAVDAVTSAISGRKYSNLDYT